MNAIAGHQNGMIGLTPGKGISWLAGASLFGTPVNRAKENDSRRNMTMKTITMAQVHNEISPYQRQNFRGFAAFSMVSCPRLVRSINRPPRTRDAFHLSRIPRRSSCPRMSTQIHNAANPQCTCTARNALMKIRMSARLSRACRASLTATPIPASS